MIVLVAGFPMACGERVRRFGARETMGLSLADRTHVWVRKGALS